MFLRNGYCWTRITDIYGTNKRVPLGTTDQKTGLACEAWLKEVQNRLDRHGILTAIIAGEITAGQAFVLGEQKAAQWLERQRAAANDPEVTDAMLDQWERDTVRGGVKDTTAAAYRWQVEQVWPTPRRRSWLAPSTIRAALRSLTCAEATKSRYRAALASLVNWMLDHDLLDENPMASVPGFGQAQIRDIWYSREEALALLNALPEPQRALEGVMYACGWEWAAIANARAKDFDLDAMTAHAHGTKTRTRDRLTVITDPVILPWLRDVKASKLPNAFMWPNVRGDTTLKVHQATCKALDLPVSTLHDWRHTFAVLNLKANRSMQFVAQMLGHVNTTQVQTRYGRYVLSVGEVQSVAAEVARQVAHNRDTLRRTNG